METEYKRNRPICRTIFRPLLDHFPFPWEDRQALPPWNWCVSCGGEVYRRNQVYCKDCLEDYKALEE